MRKVVIINTNKFLPYSETFIKNHIEGVQKYDVVVLVSELLDNGLMVENKPVLVIKNLFLGSLRDILYKLGFIVPFYDDFKRNNIKLIHSHFGQNGYASLIVAKKLKIPHVTTFHGLDISLNVIESKKDGKLLNKFRKDIEYLQVNGDVFIAVSKFIAGKLIERGFSRSKVIVNYLGIDTNYFKLPEKRLTRLNQIICVARHVEYKGLEYLLSAMAEVNRIYPSWKLVLIGDGKETDKLKAIAETGNNNVEFRGRLTSQEIKHELSVSKIYCQTSVKLDNGHEEALALTIVEAQAMGVPAIVFNSGGMPEAIVPDESGFVVEEKNIKDLAGKIICLIEDVMLWKRFSQRAIDNVKENHCFNKQLAKLEVIYDTLIQKSIL
jgi:glycosyltransferase involved in cell wall biosynthesis